MATIKMELQLITIICVLFSYTTAFNNTDDFITEINSKQDMWTAGRNFDEDTPISVFHSLLGAKMLPEHIKRDVPEIHHDTDEESIPDSFDARIQWHNCKVISNVGDQSACAASWAISTASAITDRICIHSKGKHQEVISARNLLACASEYCFGCYGGYALSAWTYWQENGLVTGGRYGSKSGCQPYPFPECDHFKNTSKLCPTEHYATPKCLQQCDNSTMDYSKSIFYGASAYGVKRNESQIKTEIMKNGPVVAAFVVYEDLIHYKSGVYSHVSGKEVGLHAVKVMGWGEEKGHKYWLAVNSWNESWGDKGTFKIRRGDQYRDFEHEVTGGIPK